MTSLTDGPGEGQQLWDLSHQDLEPECGETGHSPWPGGIRNLRDLLGRAARQDPAPLALELEERPQAQERPPCPHGAQETGQ